MFRWLAGRGASARKVARQRAQITDASWQHALARLPFLMGLRSGEQEALRDRAAWLLASKSFSGAQGFELDDRVMLSIAIQAALPVMNLDPVVYEGWTEIIVYPGGFVIPRTDMDDSGVVHEYMMEAAGEAWEGGPVILAWESGGQGRLLDSNVVIHEFAHKLDLYAGEADGVPGLHAHPQLDARRWRDVLQRAFDEFGRAVVRVEDSIPAYVDPESDEADPWFLTLPLDPYAATDEAEFFAVSSETFFVDPLRLAQGLPEWYDLLSQYYRQNPLQRLQQGAGPAHGP